MLCNMDRVNMSVAILPMQQQFAWDSKTVGLVQSSFFWCARGAWRGACRRACGVLVARVNAARGAARADAPSRARARRGYLLTQVLGGIWADRFGGKLVLGCGVVWWSLATALTPLAAQAGLVPLLAARALMGVGEGVAMPAMNNMLSRCAGFGGRGARLGGGTRALRHATLFG
jgi:ACS family sodium-dependent inorganic phosphate cotransporter